MSATVQTRVVDLDQLLPRILSQDLEGISLSPLLSELAFHHLMYDFSEEKDIENLIPWVYRHSNIADEDDQYDWPSEDSKFKLLFEEFSHYQNALAPGALSLAGPTTAKVKIVLPRKNWKVARPRNYHSQSFILHILLWTVHAYLERSREPKLEVW